MGERLKGKSRYICQYVRPRRSSTYSGNAEKLAGRVTGNPAMVERGQIRKVGASFEFTSSEQRLTRMFIVQSGNADDTSWNSENNF